MQIISREAPDDFNLFLFSDCHVGTLLHSEPAFDEMIEMMESDVDGCKYNLAAGLGDYFEAIDTSDKRFDPDTTDLEKIRPESQAEHVEEKLRPISGRIVTLLGGNHEWKLVRYCDYVRRICKGLGVPFGTYSSVLRFLPVGSDMPMLKVFVTHGAGSIRSTADDPERQEANMNLSLKRRLKNKAGDCAVMAMGHTHRLLVARPKKSLYLKYGATEIRQAYTASSQDDGYIHPDHRWYINTGSFMRLYRLGVSGYAERANYDPMELGFAIVVVRDRKVVDCKKVYL